MNLAKNDYSKYHLVREMMETPEVIRGIDIDLVEAFLDQFQTEKVLLTGEGSSRIFPAGKVRRDALENHYPVDIQIEGATQALEYRLDDYVVFLASNSGKTREVVKLIEKLKSQNHSGLCGIVSQDKSPVQLLADACYLLRAGDEKAVAATKTVVEQALFYDLLFRLKYGAKLPDLQRLGGLFEECLTMELPSEIIDGLAAADTIYWSGRTDGVAGELALKTNEITRKGSLYLEGTYAVHGIEEVMSASQSVVIIDPFSDEVEKFRDVLQKGVGMEVYAVNGRDTLFPTIKIPGYDQFTPYLQLAVGWNILVEIGIQLGIDLDNPLRARKVGNEFTGTI